MSDIIQIEVTSEDVMAFHDHHAKTHQSFIAKNWRWLIVAYCVWVFIYSGPIAESLVDWGNWLIVGFIVAISFLVTNYRRRSLSNYIKSYNQNIGPLQITFDDEKVTVTSTTSSTNYKYTAFRKVEENEKHYFVYMSTLTALILPKRNNISELMRLIEMIRRNLIR